MGRVDCNRHIFTKIQELWARSPELNHYQWTFSVYTGLTTRAASPGEMSKMILTAPLCCWAKITIRVQAKGLEYQDERAQEAGM